MARCRRDGCSTPLYEGNSSGYCRKCRQAAGPKTALAWSRPSPERPTVPGDGWFIHANGCKSRVTSDTAGEAAAFLGLFGGMTVG